jgi:hypothetical protein
VVTDKDLSVVEQHAVDSSDSGVGSFGGLVVNETVTSGSSRLVDSNLAGENVSEGGKGVVKSLHHHSRPKAEQVSLARSEKRIRRKET